MFVYVLYVLKAHRQHLLELGTSCSLIFYYPCVNNRGGPEVLFKTCVAMKFVDDDDE